LIRDSTLKCFGKKIKKGYRFVVFDAREVECWLLEEGSDSGHFEVRNRRRSPEMVWRREEGMGSSWQVVGRKGL
jgi:hypothetical protein